MADSYNTSSSTDQSMDSVVELSLSSEHVFSILKFSFRSQQDSSLQDYVECSLMLQCKMRRVNLAIDNRTT